MFGTHRKRNASKSFKLKSSEDIQLQLDQNIFFSCYSISRMYYNKTIHVCSLIYFIKTLRNVVNKWETCSVFRKQLMHKHCKVIQARISVRYKKSIGFRMCKICKVISIAIKRFEKMTLYGYKYIFVQITISWKRNPLF